MQNKRLIKYKRLAKSQKKGDFFMLYNQIYIYPNNGIGNVDSFRYTINRDFIYIDKAKIHSESLIIPDKIDNKSIVAILYESFKNMDSLKKLVIPSAVEEIGNRAFANCHNLLEVVIPGKTCYVDKDAFVGCNPNLIVRCEKDSDVDVWAKMYGYKTKPIFSEMEKFFQETGTTNVEFKTSPDSHSLDNL